MSNATITPHLYTDLHALALAMHDGPGFTPRAAATALPTGGNVRYGRELLGLLQQGGLASEDGEGLIHLDHWDNQADMLAAFESAFGPAPVEPKPVKAAKPRTARNSNAANTPCGCGCGLGVAKGRSYLPGHDARHASQVAKSIAADPSQGGRLLALLPSPALREKARAQAARLTGKATKTLREAPAKAEAKAAIPAGVVKVGRWEYPARKVNGETQRNTKRDGSGEWVAL